MNYLSSVYEPICTRLSQLREKAPSRIIDRGMYGTAAGFYSWATWSTAKSVISAAASVGLNCLKNPDPRLLMPFVESSSILALKEGLGCVEQSQQTFIMIGLCVASAGAAIYCAREMARKDDHKLEAPPLPPRKTIINPD